MPITITLTDLSRKEACREDFRSHTVRVFSHSGVHPTEAALLAHLPPQITGDVLVSGNRTGVLGLVLAAENPGAKVTQHVLDIHHVRALSRAFSANGGAGIQIACTPFMPDAAHVTLAVLQATCHDTPAELVLDQLEDLAANLPPGAACLAAYDGKPDWLRKQMKQIFGNVKATPAAAGVSVFSSRTPSSPSGTAANKRDFSASFSASLQGDAPLQLTTIPGVFAHRRPDEGGLALAEVAARDLQPGARVLDMGCGCGLVGLLLARHAAPAALLCADSHARAIHCTEMNAKANAIGGVSTLLTDEALPQEAFTLFAGNPPYYSDYKIAELFIQAAHRVLAPGGVAFIVAKSHRWHEAYMLSTFGNAEVIKRRGYGVVKSIRQAD
jgi:16S rRNA (guanine1207-N2)-methyltransferase